ncbi:DgyrCDS10041 [Dimorphilus gyrociliatus]|uniref:DgyrCDS10041 n=1 Tax=Dimorphilus gyrociliatus TaxID=2664684 RepID=A0A7I8W0G1_9ANNE|nr:DgyrCDS10041 [Dimorphilus gyrociliatus]
MKTKWNVLPNSETHMEKPVTNLEDLSKEALIKRIRKLEAHVQQLRNVLSKPDRKLAKKYRKGKPFDFKKIRKRKIALKIMYLGWDYHGFASQEESGNTIEGHLFSALTKTKLIESRETSNYHRCGRTDRGVSAFGQVISLEVRSNLKGEETEIKIENELPFCKMLNGVLPKDIRALAWCPVDEDFSARFNCTKRTYKYFFPKDNLSIEAIREASSLLIGEHDFRNLCKMDIANNVTNYTRRITYVDIKVLYERDEKYSVCELTVIGKAFLWHQIRCIVSILILIGSGKESPKIIEELLDVEKHPCKPQYNIASEIPLVLFDCEFEEVDWNFDEEILKGIVEILKENWAKSEVKNTMMKKMIETIEEDYMKKTRSIEKSRKRERTEDMSEKSFGSLSDWLGGPAKGQNYKPLFTRPTCEKFLIGIKGGKVESQTIRDNGGKFLISLFRGIEYAKLDKANPRWSNSYINYIIRADETGKFRAPCPNSENLNSEESCLFLDIYVPLNKTVLYNYENIRNKLPVLVVFSTKKLNWRTCAKLSNSLNIIIIEVQYRNDILGFLSHNIGLEDQKTAFNWITDQLDFFGGDKKSISLYGSELNAVCVSHLLNGENSLRESKMSQIHSVILIGGSYLHNYKLASERDLIYDFKCSGSSLLDCTRNLPLKTLFSVSKNYNWYPPTSKEITRRIKPKIFVPIMMGIEKLRKTFSIQQSVHSEFLSDINNFIALLRLEYGDCRTDNKQELINDLFVNSPVIRYMNALSANLIDNNNNYLYLFNNIGNYSISDLIFTDLGGLSDSDLKLKDYFLSAFKLFIKERYYIEKKGVNVHRVEHTDYVISVDLLSCIN